MATIQERLAILRLNKNLNRTRSLELFDIVSDIFTTWGLDETSEYVKTHVKLKNEFRGRWLSRPKMVEFLRNFRLAMEANYGTSNNSIVISRSEGKANIELMKGVYLLDIVDTLSNESTTLDIVSVASQDDVNVDNGTVFGSLVLPSTVDVTLDNGIVASLPVVWAEGTYNGSVDDTYTLAGTITLNNTRLTNTQVVEASIDVIVTTP